VFFERSEKNVSKDQGEVGENYVYGFFKLIFTILFASLVYVLFKEKNFRLGAVIFTMLSLFMYNHVSTIKSHQDVDSSAYLEKALVFSQTHSFVSYTDESLPYYSLGYPLVVSIADTFIQLINFVFPKSDVDTTTMLLLLQLLLSLCSGALVVRIARRLYNPLVGWLAGMLFSINLGYLVFTQFVLTEIVLATLLAAFFDRFIEFLDTRDMKYLSWSAFILGLSIVIKPAALFFVWPLCILIFFVELASFIKQFFRLAIFTICFFLPVLGWMTSNYLTFGDFATGSLAKVNLYYWFFPNVLAHESGTNSDIERDKLLKLSGGKHEPEKVSPLFWALLFKKPWLFIYVWIKNVLKTFLGLYTTNMKVLVEDHVGGGDVSFFKTSGSIIQKSWQYITSGATKNWVIGVGVFEAIWNVLRYFLCLIGLLALALRKNKLFFFTCLLYVGYFSMITGHDGCARFRMMFEFLVVTLSAGGLYFLGEGIWQKEKRTTSS